MNSMASAVKAGFTRLAFARRHGLGASTLGRWLTEARPTCRPTPVVFHEVRAAGVSSDPAIRGAMATEEAAPRNAVTFCRCALFS